MPSIMIVEDNDFFRRSFKEILKMYIPSLRVEESADGSDILAKISGSLPDMIFMDIRLPGKSGLELTREIKGLYPDQVITIFTSCDHPEYRRIARECGADHFLLKDSLTGAEIAAMVQKEARRVGKAKPATRGGRVPEKAGRRSNRTGSATTSAP